MSGGGVAWRQYASAPARSHRSCQTKHLRGPQSTDGCSICGAQAARDPIAPPATHAPERRTFAAEGRRLLFGQSEQLSWMNLPSAPRLTSRATPRNRTTRLISFAALLPSVRSRAARPTESTVRDVRSPQTPSSTVRNAPWSRCVDTPGCTARAPSDR